MVDRQICHFCAYFKKEKDMKSMPSLKKLRSLMNRNPYEDVPSLPGKCTFQDKNITKISYWGCTEELVEGTGIPAFTKKVG